MPPYEARPHRGRSRSLYLRFAGEQHSDGVPIQGALGDSWRDAGLVCRCVRIVEHRIKVIDDGRSGQFSAKASEMDRRRTTFPLWRDNHGHRRHTAKQYGPVVGGLLLAFPAIFPASATLIEKHEKEKKEKQGLNGTLRGRQAASADAAGSAMGSLGLIVFAILIWTSCRVSTPGKSCLVPQSPGCWQQPGLPWRRLRFRWFSPPSVGLKTDCPVLQTVNGYPARVLSFAQTHAHPLRALLSPPRRTGCWPARQTDAVIIAFASGIVATAYGGREPKA